MSLEPDLHAARVGFLQHKKARMQDALFRAAEAVQRGKQRTSVLTHEKEALECAVTSTRLHVRFLAASVESQRYYTVHFFPFRLVPIRLESS